MPDTTALVALVVAAVALVVTLAQLTQQLLATAYVIRKCDQIVTGGLTRGSKRQWHWRQFRFTVRYQAIVFTLPESIFSSLGISSTIQVASSTKEIWNRAITTRPQRTSAQACWVFFVQDLTKSCCLEPEDICTREEIGDRIPDDLTVAPIRVDCMTILLSGIAMGMQVSKFSPTTGEITLAGGVGSISSSIHPVLGGLLHYNIFADEPTIGFEAVKRHGRALRQPGGVWANAVFGRFRDRSYRPEMLSLYELMNRKYPVLRQVGWPEDGGADTIGGAACFMTFGQVDVYEAAPPSVHRRWTAHFAEVIVKAHHVEILKSISNDDLAHNVQQCFSNQVLYADLVEAHGCSSPYHNVGSLFSPTSAANEIKSGTAKLSKVILTQALWDDLQIIAKNGWENLSQDERDPSSYCPPAVLWKLVCLIDELMGYIRLELLGLDRLMTNLCTDRLVASAILLLSAVGPPSWGNASAVVTSWPRKLASACERALDDIKNSQAENDERFKDEFDAIRPTIRVYAELSILRSAYFSVMMRAAHPLGPGLTEHSSIETALAYMA